MTETSERRGPREENRATRTAPPEQNASIVPGVTLISEITLNQPDHRGLGDTHEGRRKYLHASLEVMPDGASLHIHVGRLRPDAPLVRLIREHRNRLYIAVIGDPSVVRMWNFYLNEGEQEVAS